MAKNSSKLFNVGGELIFIIFSYKKISLPTTCNADKKSRKKNCVWK